MTVWWYDIWQLWIDGYLYTTANHASFYRIMISWKWSLSVCTWKISAILTIFENVEDKIQLQYKLFQVFGQYLNKAVYYSLKWNHNFIGFNHAKFQKLNISTLLSFWIICCLFYQVCFDLYKFRWDISSLCRQPKAEYLISAKTI